MKRFFWLASYPKSGNTWLRLIIANLQRQAGPPIGINTIQLGGLDNNRRILDLHIGTDSDELAATDVEALRPRAYRQIARRGDGRLYSKTHDAYCAGAASLFPPDVTEAAIYVVRNPFDLAISAAYFFEKSIDEMIAAMADPDHTLSGKNDRYQPLLPQRLGRWSDHVTHWTQVRDFPVLVVRYEDMVADPLTVFTRIAAFVGLPSSAAKIRGTIEHTRFDDLQRQEMAAGFRENLSAAHMFFRNGKVGEWQSGLTSAQIARLIDDHGAVAQQLGYLDDRGRPQIVQPIGALAK